MNFIFTIISQIIFILYIPLYFFKFNRNQSIYFCFVMFKVAINFVAELELSLNDLYIL